MEPNPNNVTERILQLTLEIIYLLTGEDNIVVKKILEDGQDPITVPLHSFLIPQRNNEQKILEVTQKIIDLLTRESGNWSNYNVRIKEEIKEEEEELESVMKEWEYLEEDKDLYKDTMMDNQPPLTSSDGSRDPPQRCPRPPQDSIQEGHTIINHVQGLEVFDIKTEIKEEEVETYVSGDQLSMNEDEMMLTIIKKESSLDVGTGGHNGWISPGGLLMLSADYIKEDNRTTQSSSGVNNGSQNIHHKLNDMVRSTDWCNSEDSKDKSHIIISDVQPSFHSAEKLPDLPNPEESSPDNLHPFQDCEKSFTKKPELVVHQGSPSTERPFSCPECEKTFIKKSNLIQHQRTHTGEKPYSCTECGKGFSSKGNCDNHMRTHTGEKPFSCPECGECFAQKVTLILHQRTHTTVDHCVDQHMDLHETKAPLVKSHNERCELVRTQRNQAGEKPFPCSVCGKSFNQKSQLKTHQIVHTGERPFSCPECGKFFPSKGNRDKHMRIHTGEKPFSCSECGKCFAQKVTLIIHQNTHTT